MAADPSRLVDVRGVLKDASGEPGCTLQGSGLIVGHGLILTAAHVISRGTRWLPVRIRVAGSTESYDAEAIWPAAPNSVDVALVRVTEPPAQWPSRGVRFGRFTGRAGDRPVDAAGYPHVVREGDRREVHHLVGRVNPQAGMEGGRLRLEVASEPASDASSPQSPWAGFSGAALMSGGLVVGVIIIDTPGFAHRVLTALPVRALLDDERARELLAVQSHGDSVELDDLLEPRSRIGAPRSPAQLLRAEQEAIPFLGRDVELARLTDWAVDSAQLGVRLITGPGGRGKTRLAQELTHRLARDPQWVTGVLEGPAKGHGDVARILETTTDLRVLLMVDYAESRVQQVCDVLCAVARSADPPHLRILLLARDGGDWWENGLLPRHDELEDLGEHIALAELHPFGERTDQFHKCAREFAMRLPDMVPEVDWAERLAAVAPPDLTDAGYGDPLSIQLASMLALLGGEGNLAPASLETRLIKHEKSYWQNVLAVRGLALETRVRDQAVAAATLFSVGGRQAALRLLGRIPEMTAPGPVATWLAELYPHAKHYWGPLQPDRLGEHHIGEVSRESPEFLQELFSGTDPDEAEAALVVIGRAMAHQDHLEAQVRRLVDHGGPGMAEAITGASRFVPNPRLFLRGLGLRDTIDPDSYTPVSESSHWSGSTHGSTPGELDEEAARLRARIDGGDDGAGLFLTRWLLELADNRIRAHDKREAMRAVQEAVSRAQRADDQALLAEALMVQSGVEADVGSLERALAYAQEASGLLQSLRSGTPVQQPGVVTMLGRSLSNVAALMQRAGRNAEALKYSSEALACLDTPGPSYGDQQVLLRAEVTHGSIAASLRSFEEARTTLERSISELNRMVADQPAPPVEVFALRAAAKSNLGASLEEMGEHRLALDMLAGSLEDYSTLDDLQFAPEIARTSMNLAELASRQGDHDLAVEAARRTITEISRSPVTSGTSADSGLGSTLLSRATVVLAAHP